MQLTEKRKSPLSSLATAVLDPYAANFWLQKVNPLWSVNQSLGKIVKKEQTAKDVVSLTLQVNKKFQMANIQERRNKVGKLISYSIRVHRGRGADVERAD